MRACYPAIACLAFCVTLSSCKSSRRTQISAAAGQYSHSLTKTQPFGPGRQVHFRINVGDVRILPASSDQELRLAIQPKHPASSAEMQSWVQQVDISGQQADIQMKVPKNSDVEVTLYVPSATSLSVNLRVGNLKVDHIRGDKDISVGVGNLEISGLDPHNYGIVRNSTGVGSLEDSVFSAQKSGTLGKSENTVGVGAFQIHSHVGVGNISLDKGASSQTD